MNAKAELRWWIDWRTADAAGLFKWMKTPEGAEWKSMLLTQIQADGVSLDVLLDELLLETKP